jgi:hypothetical protein
MGSDSARYRILGCAKVFEYVAATCLTQLVALVESQAEWRDDRKAIERTVLVTALRRGSSAAGQSRHAPALPSAHGVRVAPPSEALRQPVVKRGPSNSIPPLR